MSEEHVEKDLTNHYGEVTISIEGDSLQSCSKQSRFQETISVLKKTPSVTNLYIRCVSMPEMETLSKEIINNCEHIRRLFFMCDCELNVNIIKALLHKFPDIETISAFVRGEECQECINLLAACQQLWYICLKVKDIQNEIIDLNPLAEGCPELTKLEIPELEVCPNSLVKVIQKKSRQLESLKIDTSSILPSTILPFASCVSLENITFFVNDDSKVTYNLLQSIGSAPALKSLTLDLGENVCLCEMGNCLKSTTITNITELRVFTNTIIGEKLSNIIRNCFLNVQKLIFLRIHNKIEEGAETLLTFKKLNELKLFNIDFIYNYWVEILVQQKCITTLYIPGNSTVNNSELSQIVSKLDLISLNISSCPSLTEEVCKEIIKCKTLKELYMSYSDFSGLRVIEMVMNLNLTKIDVSECNNIYPFQLEIIRTFVPTVTT